MILKEYRILNTKATFTKNLNREVGKIPTFANLADFRWYITHECRLSSLFSKEDNLHICTHLIRHSVATSRDLGENCQRLKSSLAQTNSKSPT